MIDLISNFIAAKIFVKSLQTAGGRKQKWIDSNSHLTHFVSLLEPESPPLPRSNDDDDDDNIDAVAPPLMWLRGRRRRGQTILWVIRALRLRTVATVDV